MALSSYANLQTAVKNWLDNSNIDAYIPDFITLAEARIYRELRVQAMITSFSSAIASGTLSVPSGFLEWAYVYIDGSPAKPLGVQSAEYILAKYPTRSSDSKPDRIARDGSSFIFGPYPDSNYTVKGSYYKRMTALVSASTNWFITDAPDLLLYATLLEAEPFIMNDERLIIWESKYQNAKRRIEQEERRGRLSGPLRSEAR